MNQESIGQLSVKVLVVHPSDPTRFAEVELIVDTAANLSCVPREIIQKVGAPKIQTRTFRLPDGRKVDRDTFGMVLRLNECETYGTVVAAEVGDRCVLGLTTLQMLGLRLDPVNNQLVSQPLLAM